MFVLGGGGLRRLCFHDVEISCGCIWHGPASVFRPTDGTAQATMYVLVLFCCSARLAFAPLLRQERIVTPLQAKGRVLTARLTCE
jgi:hypothetical protein